MAQYIQISVFGRTLVDDADAATARGTLLPSKTGNTLKVLRVNAGETDYELATVSGGSAPFDDATAIIKGSGDATKLFRIEADTNIPTGTTVVGTVPATSFTFAGLGVAQTFTAQQIFETGTGGGTPVIIRQTGGTPGTDEGQISHDGTDLVIKNKDSSGGIQVLAYDGTLVATLGRGGNYRIELGSGSQTTGFYGDPNAAGFALSLKTFTMCLDFLLAWRSGSHWYDGSYDTDLHRIAAKIVGAGDGSTGAGWLQNSAGEAALASNFTKTNATLGNTNLSLTLIAGRSYRIEGYLIVSNSTPSEGFQMDFNGGSATATTFDAAISAVGSDVAGTVVSASLATVMNYTTITGTNRIFVRGYIKCNAGGTFILRAAENTTAAGTMTLAAGSWLALYDTVNL